MHSLRAFSAVLFASVVVSACSGEPGDPAVETAQGLGDTPVLKSRAEMIAMMDDIGREMDDLRKLQASMNAQFLALAAGYGRMSAAADGVISAAAGGSQDQLLAATKQMQETQMSFNLQYLQLQSQMQAENRSYTAVSNIMKTKHDTVKNSISNVR